MKYILIKDYFKECTGLNEKDEYDLQELRNTINSFRFVKEQAEFIEKWRSIHSDWDERVLNIPRNASIDPCLLKSTASNKFYSYYISNIDLDKDIENNTPKKKKRKKNSTRQKIKEKRQEYKNRHNKTQEVREQFDEAEKEALQSEREYTELEFAYNHKDEEGFDQSFIERFNQKSDIKFEDITDEDLANKKAERDQKRKASDDLNEELQDSIQAENEAYRDLSIAKNKSGLILAFKILCIVLSFVVTFNIILYAFGGIKSIMGSTPFATCDSKSGSSMVDLSGTEFKKVIEYEGVEMKIPGNPWQYGDSPAMAFDGSGLGAAWTADWDATYAEHRSDSNYVFSDYLGPEEKRGVGTYIEEDFAKMTYADGTPIDTNNAWIINMRWEYCGFYVRNLDRYSNGIGDVMSEFGDDIQAATGSKGPVDNAYYSQLLKQKILVVNPENGKSCVCMVGDGHSNPNWGPAPSNRLGGLSASALEYLEYQCTTNMSKYLDVYFIDSDNPESISVGPYMGSSFQRSENGCSTGNLSLIDASSIGDLASSLCWSTKQEATANDGTEAYQKAHDTYTPDIWPNRCCATFVSTVLVGAGAIPLEAAASNCVDLYNKAMYNNPDWVEVIPTQLSDLQPGDVCFTGEPVVPKSQGGFHHVAVIGSAPSITGDTLELCQASIAYDANGYLPEQAQSAWTSQYRFQTFQSNFDHYYRYVGSNLTTANNNLGDPEPGIDGYEYTPQEGALNKKMGTVQGPSGKETYYNLDMSGCVKIMRNDYGFSEDEYPYWVRDDGVKMFGRYVMVAAELNLRPKGTLVETSLGMGIVVDTGEFAYTNQTQLDIAVNW